MSKGTFRDCDRSARSRQARTLARRRYKKENSFREFSYVSPYLCFFLLYLTASTAGTAARDRITAPAATGTADWSPVLGAPLSVPLLFPVVLTSFFPASDDFPGSDGSFVSAGSCGSEGFSGSDGSCGSDGSSGPDGSCGSPGSSGSF